MEKPLSYQTATLSKSMNVDIWVVLYIKSAPYTRFLNRKKIFEKFERKFFYSNVAGSIWFVFYFKLNIFASKILNLLLPSENEGTGGQGQ